MANWFAEMEARQSEARVAFGRMLRLWRERNGWTQYTVADWGKQAGFPAISYGNLSAIEQGKAGELRRPAFFQLAEVNQRLFKGELGAITDKELREKIKAGQPLLGADGQPWGPQELWSCYVGLQEVPEAYRQPQRGDAPRLSAAKARELSRRWREQVGEAIEARQLDPLQALQAIARLAPLAQRKQLRTVLSSFGDYSPVDLQQLWDGEWLPQQWIDSWLQGLDCRSQAAEMAQEQQDLDGPVDQQEAAASPGAQP
jgi:transcriptional regulator with XRE-family HTH domain